MCRMYACMLHSGAGGCLQTRLCPKSVLHLHEELGEVDAEEGQVRLEEKNKKRALEAKQQAWCRAHGATASVQGSVPWHKAVHLRLHSREDDIKLPDNVFLVAGRIVVNIFRVPS